LMMWSHEAFAIAEELCEAFRKTRGHHFEWSREFRNRDGKVYLRVRVVGFKLGGIMQYDIFVEHWHLFKFKGEVKGMHVLIEVESISSPTGILEYLNILLKDLELIKALTIIPSDCGEIRELRIHFKDLEADNLNQKELIIPLR